MLLPQFPGLDGGSHGHWGNQSEETWADARWNQTDLGTVLCGVFRGSGRDRSQGRLRAARRTRRTERVLQPRDAVLRGPVAGGFVRFSAVRHGFLDGLIMDGTPLPRPAGTKPEQAVRRTTAFTATASAWSSRIASATRNSSMRPGSKAASSQRVVAPAANHPLAGLTAGGPPQWPQVLTTSGQLGQRRPYAIDTIEPPFQNPWKTPLFFGDHDFLPDGSAMLCTMQGDVWHVDGLDDVAGPGALAAVRLGAAPGARPGGRRRHGPRPGSRPDHAPARPERRRRGRLLRVCEQRLPDLALRPRFHLRTSARRRGPTSTRSRASRDSSEISADGKTVDVWPRAFAIPTAWVLHRAE